MCVCDNITFSIIVPVFNSENTIVRCLESILKQEDLDIEIIIVDDGSTDNGIELIRNSFSDYQCIKIIQKNNGGVSSARNLGLLNAIGNYVLFIDSDDWIADGFFAYLRDEIGKTKADIITTELSINTRQTYDYYGTTLVNSETYLNFRNKLFNGSVCGKAFAKRTVSNLRFDEKIVYEEDSLFVCQDVLQSNVIAISKKSFYIYELNEESATHNYVTEKLITRFDARQKITYEITRLYPHLYACSLTEEIICAEKVILLSMRNRPYDKEKLEPIRRFIKLNKKHLLHESIDRRLIIAGILLMINPTMAYKSMQMIENITRKNYQRNINLMKK